MSMGADAILGTFVNIKTMADGTPRLVLDLQCGLSEVAAMGLIPGVPFAIARLTKEAAGRPVVAPVSQPQESKEKPGQLCVMAVNFCKDPLFIEFMDSHFSPCLTEEEAKTALLEVLGISSRRELDSDPKKAEAFHSLIRKPFLAWRDAQ
jgi:hypothetical protein